MIYNLELNIDVFFDISHGLHNDLANAVNDSGLKSHILMTLLRLNVVVGPWQEDVRWKQLIAGLEELLQSTDPRKVPLFMAAIPEIMTDPAVEHLLGEDDPAQAIWDYSKQHHPFINKGIPCMEPPHVFL